MITIRLVRENGLYVGRHFSDSWNLYVLKADYDLDPNKTGLTKFRGDVRALGFKVQTLGAVPVVNELSFRECQALSLPTPATSDTRVSLHMTVNR